MDTRRHFLGKLLGLLALPTLPSLPTLSSAKPSGHWTVKELPPEMKSINYPPPKSAWESDIVAVWYDGRRVYPMADWMMREQILFLIAEVGYADVTREEFVRAFGGWSDEHLDAFCDDHQLIIIAMLPTIERKHGYIRVQRYIRSGSYAITTPFPITPQLHPPSPPANP